MAVVLGTNAGFVTTAPTADPSGSLQAIVDNICRAVRHTAPAGATAITEIGWWCDGASEAANFEVGVYGDSSDSPGSLLAGSSQTNAKGTGSGWKVVAGLNISVTAGSVYWIAVQVDNTATNTLTDRDDPVGCKYAFLDPAATLPSPFGTPTATGQRLFPFYAVYATGGTTYATQLFKHHMPMIGGF